MKFLLNNMKPRMVNISTQFVLIRNSNIEMFEGLGLKFELDVTFRSEFRSQRFNKGKNK